MTTLKPTPEKALSEYWAYRLVANHDPALTIEEYASQEACAAYSPVKHPTEYAMRRDYVIRAVNEGYRLWAASLIPTDATDKQTPYIGQRVTAINDDADMETPIPQPGTICAIVPWPIPEFDLPDDIFVHFDDGPITLVDRKTVKALDEPDRVPKYTVELGGWVVLSEGSNE